MCLGFDGRTVSAEEAEQLGELLKEKNITFAVNEDLIGEIWSERPALSCEPVMELDVKWTGESRKDKIARKYIIVGGAGHTTEALRQKVHKEYPDVETRDKSEAEVFQSYLQTVHDCAADYLETASTNCGNNITCLLDLLREKGICFQSIILTQDASMQNRMDAGLRKYVQAGAVIINFAAYSAEASDSEGVLTYREQIHGMWTMDRYVNLLMGEIPRLRDDENGYGPKGKDYIAHVDIPENVKAAFEELQTIYGRDTREANPMYASK